jgi:8-oxo-dGTP pyrophosphatase MutT (NUDIX family)
MDKKTYVGIAVICNNKLLLCKRNNQGSFPGMWSIPAGKLEENESTQDGAKREFFEETNIDINEIDITFAGIVPRTTRDGKKIKGLMYVYRLDSDVELEPDLENAKDGDEHTDWGYFSINEISPETSGTYLHKLAEIILK